MPTIFQYKGYRFFFNSNEGSPLEPLHIHVRKGKIIAKFWLEPEPKIAYSYGFTPKLLRLLLKIAINHKEDIQRAWDEHFNQ